MSIRPTVHRMLLWKERQRLLLLLWSETCATLGNKLCNDNYHIEDLALCVDNHVYVTSY